jgi:hypothetical protein
MPGRGVACRCAHTQPTHRNWREQMNGRALRRAAINTSLEIARMPLDGAIRLLPDQVRPTAKRAVDQTERTARTVLSAALRDRRLKEPGSKLAKTDRTAAPTSATTARPAPEPVGPVPAAEPGARPAPRPAPHTTPAPRPQRAAAARRPRHEATPAAKPRAKRPAAAPSEPSQEAIAARAYELYEQGLPGGPNDHWQAAVRDLSAKR